MLLTALIVNDNITMSLTLAAPLANSRIGSLLPMRDQKQVLFKIRSPF